MLAPPSKDRAGVLTRPHDPWVFRSVLDNIPRMVTLALHEDAWAAYSTERCALYKVWKGSVNLEGSVYNTQHGPQPTSTGDAYLIQENSNPWFYMLEGTEQSLTPQYRGHRLQDDQVTLLYEFSIDGSQIEVEETVEAEETDQGQIRFIRTFDIKGLPQNYELGLHFNAKSVIGRDALDIEGGQIKIVDEQTVKVKNRITATINGFLFLQNGSNIFAITFQNDPQVKQSEGISSMAKASAKPLGSRLIDQSDCKTCHNEQVKTIGPAYIEVAKAYRTTPENISSLVKKIINGGSGVWGEQLMSAHPDLQPRDAQVMVEYILSLDNDQDSEDDIGPIMEIPSLLDIESSEVKSGLVAKVFMYEQMTGSVNSLNTSRTPDYDGIYPKISFNESDFGKLTENFYINFSGFLNAPENGEYDFRLISDDGSMLYLNNQQVIDHDGYHGPDAKMARASLQKGYYAIEVPFFQGAGGRTLQLYWKTPSGSGFEIVPQQYLSHLTSAENSLRNNGLPFGSSVRIPGDGFPLVGVHPSYDLSQARPNDFLPKVGGMDFLPDGRLVISTWDAEGGVYILDGVETGDPSQITVKKIATGLAEPLGLKVVEGNLYVLQKQELTQLIDLDGDELIDEYRAICNSWTVSTNFHEFAFGLANKGDDLYASLAIQILPGGASGKNQPMDRGKAIRINRHTGVYEFIAHGLRTPNGVGIGIDDELFIADNQGDWLPSSKILHVEKGDFFGSRAVDFEGTAGLTVKQPVVWLPQDEIGNSPTTPSFINDGPYKGQMIHSEVTNGGVKRVFVEKVEGAYQGAVFRFIQGLESGINRLVWGPDGALYVGGVGSTGNWVHSGKLWYGLQRLKYNNQSTFEMLAVRAKSNGVEIEFTETLKEGDGWNIDDYEIAQWYYLPTANYGGPKLDERPLSIRSVNVSDDRKKVFLEIGGMREGHVIYVHLNKHFISDQGHQLWSTEAWYTMNTIPVDNPGFRSVPVHSIPNTLTQSEKESGWKLLFDGNTTDGWHNYQKEGIGSAWKVIDGALVLDNSIKDENGRITGGGDIVTDEEFESFELSLEWKIQACGNSGIMFYVAENEGFKAPYHTGPEMQILDNTCHPDAQHETHRAGDLYAMIACSVETVKPAGQWNHVIIKIVNGRTEFWQNGIKVVEFSMWTDEWEDMVAQSKFKAWENFGKYKKGRIVLQDHTDRVSFRNIKIREITENM